MNRPGLGELWLKDNSFDTSSEASTTKHPHAAEVRGVEVVPRWPLQASCTQYPCSDAFVTFRRTLLGEARERHATASLGNVTAKPQPFLFLSVTGKALQALCDGVLGHPRRLSWSVNAKRKLVQATIRGCATLITSLLSFAGEHA